MKRTTDRSTEVKAQASRVRQTVAEHSVPHSGNIHHATENHNVIENDTRNIHGHGRDASMLEPNAEAPIHSGPHRPEDAAIDSTVGHTHVEPSRPTAVPAKSHVLRSLGWLLQILAALGAGYWFATTRAAPDARVELSVPESTNRDDAVVVTIAPVTPRGMVRSITAVGNLHGYDELTLKNKISGRVGRIHRDFADRVRPGALLIEIDPTDAQLAVEQAKRSLNSELAKWGFQDVPGPNPDLTRLPTVVSAQLRSEWSRSQHNRLLTLKERGAVVAEEIENARTNALVAESDYANQLLLARSGAATAQLKKAELDIAEQHLAETLIYAPQRDEVGSTQQAPYTITERFVTEGAWLVAGSDLFRLVIEDTLKLRLTIPEKHANSVRVGQRVEVTTLSSDTSINGTVARIGPAVDRTTRTFQVEAEVPNSAGLLKTGAFAKANIVTDAGDTAQTVPVTALVSFAGVHKVFVVDAGKVTEFQVKLGEQTAEWVEIIEPQLPPSAIVVTSGQTKLATGSAVRVRNARAAVEVDGPTAVNAAAQTNAPAGVSADVPTGRTR